MTLADVFRTIQFVLAPVVMITSCGIIINGFLTRYEDASDRMRALARERLSLLWGSPDQQSPGAQPTGRYATERLKEIDHQIPTLLTRHHMLRNALQALYLAMLVFVLSMFVILIAVWANTRPAAIAALGVFLGGQVTLLIGLSWSVAEIRISNVAVEYEARRVQALRASSMDDTQSRPGSESGPA